jgi:predicted flap endonuclease-1-like 5' DNA nuclease
MKKIANWFVLGFVVWCIVSALWYLFGVKGVVSHANEFDAANRFIAIAEILFMLLGACLFGFAIAWWLRAEVISAVEASNDQLQSENTALNSSREEINERLQASKSFYSAQVSAMKLKIAELNHEAENLKKRWLQEEEVIQKLKIEKAEKTRQLEQKKEEAEKLTNQINQLGSICKRLEQTNMELESEVKQLRANKEEKRYISNHPFVKPVVDDRKDDLTKIKGIGPFVEKRLNMLGIYNFEQLGSLEPEMVERVGAAIEFFPDRILRENWIGQAKDLFNKTRTP